MSVGPRRARAPDGPLRRLEHRQHVVAVDGDALEAVRRRAIRHVLDGMAFSNGTE